MVMAPERPQNGRSGAGALAPLRLGDTTPETREIEINGRVLKGWVMGNGRYPASVAAELDDARNDYIERRELLVDGPPPQPLVEIAQTIADSFGEGGGGMPSPEVVTDMMNDLRRSLEAATAPQYKTRESDWAAYVTRVLMLLIPGLEEHEADMLPSDWRLQILVELGFLNLPEGTEGAPAEGVAEAQQSPPVPTEPSQKKKPRSTGSEPEQPSAVSTG